MARRVTITLSDDVYSSLARMAGQRSVNRFVEDLLRPYAVKRRLDSAYRDMASDQAREIEALEWAEALVSDLY